VPATFPFRRWSHYSPMKYLDISSERVSSLNSGSTDPYGRLDCSVSPHDPDARVRDRRLGSTVGGQCYRGYIKKMPHASACSGAALVAGDGGVVCGAGVATGARVAHAAVAWRGVFAVVGVSATRSG